MIEVVLWSEECGIAEKRRFSSVFDPIGKVRHITCRVKFGP